MAYKNSDYLYVIVVTILFIFQLYCYFMRNRDVLLSILFPVAIIFTAIYGIKSTVQSQSDKMARLNSIEYDEESPNLETKDSELTFRIIFILLNFFTLAIYLMYIKNVPAVSFRKIKVAPQLIYSEDPYNPGVFRAEPVCVAPDHENVAVDKEVRIVSGNIRPNSGSKGIGNPTTFDFNGERYIKENAIPRAVRDANPTRFARNPAYRPRPYEVPVPRSNAYDNVERGPEFIRK